MILLGTLESTEVRSTKSSDCFRKSSQWSVLWRSCQPCVPIQRDDLLLLFCVLSARIQRFVTALALQNDLQAATELGASIQATGIVFIEFTGFRWRLPRSSDPSHSTSPSSSSEMDKTAQQVDCKSARSYHLQWWRIQRMFGHNDGRRRFWRQARGERFADCAVVDHDRFGGSSFLVWAGIWTGGRTEAHATGEDWNPWGAWTRWWHPSLSSKWDRLMVNLFLCTTVHAAKGQTL